MTPEMNARANVLLNAIADEMRAKGRNAEVRHQVGEEFKGTFGTNHYGTRTNPCLFLDGISCEIGFRQQSAGGYYNARAASGLLQVELEGVRNRKTYGSLKTTRSWKETKDKDGKLKPMDVAKIAETIILYSDTRKTENDEHETANNKLRAYQDQARALNQNNIPAAVRVTGSETGLSLTFNSANAEEMAKVLEAIRTALA